MKGDAVSAKVKEIELDAVLTAAGVDVPAAKERLVELQKAFGKTGVPDGALRNWADRFFHGASVGMAVGRAWGA